MPHGGYRASSLALLLAPLRHCYISAEMRRGTIFHLIVLLLLCWDGIAFISVTNSKEKRAVIGKLFNSFDGKVSHLLHIKEHSNSGGIKQMYYNDISDAFIAEKSVEFTQSQSKLVRILRNSFLPSGALNSDYYKYTLWRIAQRFMSATTSVFGTQALLLALGFKKNSIGIAAATTWVLKDILGKFSRIIWASKYGRRFDSDAKKWRFRSSLLFAAGSSFEVFTYLVPSLFLVIAAIANAMKQMAMLTSSATRNAIYKSFARNSDNIGDITAKGEAQIAVVDLLGMVMGIMVSRAIGTSRTNIASIFLILSTLDIFCIFNEIKSVVFYSLNYERVGIVIRHLLSNYEKLANYNDSLSTEQRVGSIANPGSVAFATKQNPTSIALTPSQVSEIEKIFLPSKFGEEIFCLFSKHPLTPSVIFKYINQLTHRESDDKLIITLHASSNSSHIDRILANTGIDATSLVCRINGSPIMFKPSILLHKDASPFDVFRGLIIVHKILFEVEKLAVSSDEARSIDLDDETLINIVNNGYKFEKENLRLIVNNLRVSGWDMSKFMFGNIRRRVEWEIQT